MLELSSIEESQLLLSSVSPTAQQNANNYERMRSQSSAEKTAYIKNNNSTNVEPKQRSWVITNSNYRKKYSTKIITSSSYTNTKNGMQKMEQNRRNSGKTTPNANANATKLPRKSYSERNTPVDGLSGCLATASFSANSSYIYPKPRCAITPIMSGLDLLALAAEAASESVADKSALNQLNLAECNISPCVPYVPNIEQDIADEPPKLLQMQLNDSAQVTSSLSMSSVKTSSISTLSVLTSSSSSSISLAAMDSPKSHTASPVLMQQQLEEYATIKHPKPIMALSAINMQSPITTAAELEARVLERAKTQAAAAALKETTMNATKQTDEMPVNNIKINAWVNFKFTKTFVRDLFH